MGNLFTEMKRRYIFRLAAVVSIICSVCWAIPSSGQATTGPKDCNQATPEPLSYVKVPGFPFSAIPSRDGCWVFVSLAPATANETGGIAVLRRSGGSVSLVRVVPVHNNPAGMVLTHDGKLLISSDNDGVVVLDVRRLVSGGDAVLAYMPRGPAEVSQESFRFIAAQFGEKRAAETVRTPGSIYVNVTKDDALLFVSDEWVQTISVIDLKKARRSDFGTDSLVGRIPVAISPIALTFSPDERYLFTTGQAALSSYGWPAECKPEMEDPAKAQAQFPQGAVLVIDVKKAKKNPETAVISKTPAGCTPVRLALSPNGATAYVTARNSNLLMVFDTAGLVRGSPRSLTAKLQVGKAPVGVVVFDRGAKIAVTNSNRFFSNGNESQSLSVVNVAAIASGSPPVLGSIPAGGFPREIRLTSDQKTMLVTNYSSKTVEFIDLQRLPLAAIEKSP